MVSLAKAQVESIRSAFVACASETAEIRRSLKGCTFFEAVELRDKHIPKPNEPIAQISESAADSIYSESMQTTTDCSEQLVSEIALFGGLHLTLAELIAAFRGFASQKTKRRPDHSPFPSEKKNRSGKEARAKLGAFKPPAPYPPGNYRENHGSPAAAANKDIQRFSTEARER